MNAARHPVRRLPLLVIALSMLVGCDRAPEARAPGTRDSVAASGPPEPPDEPSPPFRNVEAPTAYVGDAACASCHARETSVYRQHAMAKSFHRWTPATRVETALSTPIRNTPTGYSYSVADDRGQLYQVERLTAPDGKTLHELRRRMDYVMGSGQVARTYFTEENGRLFQLPLTWYRTHGWDFSPGYEINNARFDRLMPDRCIGCHSSYPRALPGLEGKYAELRPGIGCERCHGPGALHVAARRAASHHAGAYDSTIVNPAHLPLERRMDVCEQCHVHTAVTVLRDGKTDFSYMPSQPLRDQYAFFKVAGTIDVVSHADRLRQSRCFLATRATATPLECATCHNPHETPDPRTRNQPCQRCHASALLQQRLARSAALADHGPSGNCVGCHMPRTQERAVPHGGFTDHWIRVITPGSSQPTVQATGEGPIEPFYSRDRAGVDADVYRGMGEIVYATLANNGRALSNAASMLDGALGADTGRGDAHFLLGAAYQQLGRRDDAIRALEQSVRIDSSHPDRLRALAMSYDLAGRVPARVDSLYRRALAIQPALAWIRADYGDFLQMQNRREEARRAYRRALAEQPSLASAWFNLGALLLEAGHGTASNDAFRRAIALDPSLAAGLSSLLEVRATGSTVTGVRALESPLPSLPMRDRGPGAVQITVAQTAAGASFTNTPPRAVIQVLKPDGTLLRSLPTGDGGLVHWNLLTDAGRLIGSGLYRAQVLGRDLSGRPIAPQPIYFGVVGHSAN